MYSRMGMRMDPVESMLRSATPPPESDMQNFFKWIDFQINVEMDRHLKWYFVTALWMKKFKHWVRNRPRRSNVLEPGPVDITGLGPLDDIPEDESCFVPVSEHLWAFIFKRYGILDNREPVWRYRVGPCIGVAREMIERKLQDCTFYRWDEMGLPRRWKFSLYDNPEALYRRIRDCFKIPKDVAIRVWSLWDEVTDLWDVFHEMYTRIIKLYEDIRKPWKHTFKVEIFQDGCFPLSTPRPFLPRITIHGLCTNHKDNTPEHPRVPAGMAKIYCSSSDSYFVNAIVILAHIPSIRNFFTSDMYLRELNPENPMGRKGEFAERIGDIMKHLWIFNEESYGLSFTRFREVFKKANSMYADLDNMDIMPYMQFLIDSLHEDCNRVKEKVKLERPDSKQRPAAEVAGEFWDIFKKSNDSVFLDTCYGLVHNSSRCHGCNLSKNTFEAVSGITLPMHYSNNVFKVVFRFHDLKKPLLVTRLRFCMTLSVETVQKKIAKAFGIKPFTFSLIYKKNRGFEHVINPLKDHVPFRGDYAENYLIALEHPPEWKGTLILMDEEEKLHVRPVVLECPWLPHRQAWTLGMFDEVCTFTVPYLVMCSTDATYDDWVNILEEKFKDIFPRPAEGDEWWHWKSPEDDEYDARVKKYQAISREIFEEPPLENKDNIWEKNGRHYYFRLKLNNEQEVPNDDERLIPLGGEYSVHMEPHKLYARKYLEHLMDFKPNVKVMGEWWLVKPDISLFTLEETLEAWGQEHSRGLSNVKNCETCGNYKTHTDRTGFWHLPNYLFMNVYRFVVNYNDRLNGGIRNNAVVVIPEKGLDLGPYVTGPLAEGEETLYDLHSLSMHIGYSILQSAYISFIKYEVDGQFYRFNGNFFPSYPEEFLSHHGNYFFCYKRRGFEDFTFPVPEGGISQPQTLDPPSKSRPGPSLIRGPEGLMIVDDDLFRMEKPNMMADDLILDAGILKLKSHGISTKKLETIRSHRKAMRDRDLVGASSSVPSKVPMKCELDSDSDEEMGKSGAVGKGYSYLGKGKK